MGVMTLQISPMRMHMQCAVACRTLFATILKPPKVHRKGIYSVYTTNRICISVSSGRSEKFHQRSKLSVEACSYLVRPLVLSALSSSMLILNFLATGTAILSFALKAHYDRSSTRLYKRADNPNVLIEAGVVQPRVFYGLGSDTSSQEVNGILTAYGADLIVQSVDNPNCTSDLELINEGDGVNCSYAIDASGAGITKANFLDTLVYGGSTNHTIKFYNGFVNLTDDLFNATFLAIAEGVTTADFGVGYPYRSFQATYDLDSGNVTLVSGYITPMQAMKSQGLIDSESYSVWLPSTDPWSHGGLTLGGVDRDRFDDNITSFPIEHEWYQLSNGTVITLKSYSDPLVVVDTLTITNATGYEYTILSGLTQFSFNFKTQDSVLPQKLVDVLISMFNGTLDSSGYILCPCGVPASGGSITFYIRGYRMRIPFSSFIRPLRDYNGNWMSLNDGTLQCFLAVTPTTGTTGYSFGMAMLTSQYVVVNMDSNEIGVAPYNDHNNTDAGTISSMDTSGIVFATEAPSYSSSYDLSDSSLTVYTPTFVVAMHNISTSAGSQSGSAANLAPLKSDQVSSLLLTQEPSQGPSQGSSEFTTTGPNSATQTTTGFNLKSGTVTYDKTVVSTVNGSPPLVASAGYVLAGIFWFLM